VQRLCMVFKVPDRGNEPVTALRQGFDETGILGIVAQRLAELVDRDSQAVIEVDRRVSAPKLLLQLLAA